MTANIQIPHKLIYKLNIMFALGFGDVRDRRTLSLLEITADCPHGKSSNCTRGARKAKKRHQESASRSARASNKIIRRKGVKLRPARLLMVSCMSA